MMATELVDYLNQVFSNLPIKVIELKCGVKVVPHKLKDDKFMRSLLDTHINKIPYQDQSL
jgi:hypothetical protein